MPNCAAVPADEIAMSANCSDVGSGTIAQSPYASTRSARHIKKMLDTVDTSGTVLMISNAGRTVCAVVCAAPDTMPSTMQLYTSMVPKYETSYIISRACSTLIPFALRNSAYWSAN